MEIAGRLKDENILFVLVGVKNPEQGSGSNIIQIGESRTRIFWRNITRWPMFFCCAATGRFLNDDGGGHLLRNGGGRIQIGRAGDGLSEELATLWITAMSTL
jgi:hypothetical protein